MRGRIPCRAGARGRRRASDPSPSSSSSSSPSSSSSSSASSSSPLPAPPPSPSPSPCLNPSAELPSSEKKQKQKQSSHGRRVIRGRIYDSEAGVTCHWCRQKTVEAHVRCSRCPIAFCGSCLRNRHGELITLEMASPRHRHHPWTCPKCRGGCGLGCSNTCCNCGPCRKAQGLGPTGSLVRIARASGFSNVHDFLIAQRTGETPEAIWARKRGKQWCWSGEVEELCRASIPCSARSGHGDGDGDGDGDGVDDGKSSRSPAQAQTCRKRLNFSSQSPPGYGRRAARSKSSASNRGIVGGNPPASRKPPAKRSRRKSALIRSEKPIESAPLVAGAEHRGQSQHVLPVEDEKISMTVIISPRAIEEEKMITPDIGAKVVGEEKIGLGISPKAVVEEEEIEGDLSPQVAVEEEKIKRVMSPRAVKEEAIEISAPSPSVASSSAASALPWMHHPPSNLAKIDQKDDARERSSSISTLRNLLAPMPATSSGIAFDQGPVDAMRSKQCGPDFVARSDEDGEDAAEDRARGARNLVTRALIDVKSENPWLEEVPTFCPNVILEVRVKKKFAKERQEAVSGGGADDDDAAKRKELLLVHGKQQLQQHQHQHVCNTSTFKERLDAKLSEPFDGKELETLLRIASHRKPMYRARETRNSSVQVILNQEGNSYLDYYPELEECLRSTNCPLLKLSILRGFFFWLENASNVGAFKPWSSSMPRSSSDDDCMEIDGPDCKILAVVYSVGDDDDKSNE